MGFDQYETISRQVPTMVAEGNHETDWPGRRPVGASDRFANTATDSGVHSLITIFNKNNKNNNNNNNKNNNNK